jgi:single-strand DNA-binding protein
MNIVVLRGVLSRTPDLRELSSGSTLLQFDVSTPTNAGTASVPVAWFDPPGAPEFAAGVEVAVLGEVRRRFFRAGGSTQSRTEVVALRVARVTNRRGVSALLSQAATLLGDAG